MPEQRSFTYNRLTVIGPARDAKAHYGIIDPDHGSVEFWVDLPHPRRIGEQQALRCVYFTSGNDAQGWMYDINGMGPQFLLEGELFDWDGGLGMSVSRLQEMPRLDTPPAPVKE